MEENKEVWKILTVRASKELRRKARVKAKENGVNLAEYVRMLIERDCK